MDASQHHFLEPASSPFHASTFTDPYHVSPIPSPETTTNRLMVPGARTQQQAAQDPMSFHWSGAAAPPFSDYQTGFSTSPDWQTLPPFEPHGLPYDYTHHPAMMPYVSAWKDPMDSVEYSTTQPGSFSSTDSSSFGHSFTSNSFSVHDNWQQTHEMAHQYSLRPRLQLPAAEERDTSLEGTISPKLTRIIPSPSFQSAPSSPTHLFPRRDSGSSSSSDGTVEDQPVTKASSTSKGPVPKPAHRHQRTRLPSPPKSSSRGSLSRRLLALAPSSTSKTKTTTTSSSKHLKPTKEPKPSHHSQPTEPATIPSRPDSSRAAKDEFLLKSKAKGMTYKEIRRKGNFSEAESTLRGRYRTLTKPKDLRVRKPEWSENDVSPLPLSLPLLLLLLFCLVLTVVVDSSVS
jgi:hypothetical protein